MLKTKHKLPAKGQIILEERCDGKREIGDRGRGGTGVNAVGEKRYSRVLLVQAKYIQNTNLDGEYFSFLRGDFSF